MSTRAKLSETLNRLLPGEQWKRVREGILQGANYSGQRTDQLRQSIDEANRIRTGRLVEGVITISSDTSAQLSGWVWAVDFGIKQPTGITTLAILAPDPVNSREDYFIGTNTGAIIYRAGSIDALGNASQPSYDSTNEVVLVSILRNPDSDEIMPVYPANDLIDFVEQNIIPIVLDGKLKNSGIKAILDAIGGISAYKFPKRVSGQPALSQDDFVTLSQLEDITTTSAPLTQVFTYSTSNVFNLAYSGVTPIYVTLNGQILQQGLTYDWVVSGSQLTVTAPLNQGNEISILYYLDVQRIATVGGNIDGGTWDSVYLPIQNVDGGIL